MASAALDAGLYALHGAGVGAGDEQKVGMAACLGGGGQFALHLRRRDEGLALQVAAALGGLLVLQMEAGQAGLLVGLDRAHHLQRISVSGVRVAEGRHLHGLGDVPGLAGHLVHAQQTDVGVPGQAVDQPGPRDIDRRKTQLLGEHGHWRVEGPGQNHGPFGDEPAQGVGFVRRFRRFEQHIPVRAGLKPALTC
jgi:hypothetical protein